MPLWPAPRNSSATRTDRWRHTCAGLRSGEESKTQRLLRSLEFYSVTCETAQAAGLIQNEWRRRGHKLTLPGATIAALALEHGLVLVTANVKRCRHQEANSQNPLFGRTPR